MEEVIRDLAFRREVFSPGESFHVESPAGAGKTSLLTARFIHLLAQVNHPQEILALTFTNKAANEMLERVQTLLVRAESDSPGDSAWINEILPVARKVLKKHRRNEHCFQSPEGLQITTFHSFCNQIIRQAPAEAQVPLGASILNEEEQTELIQEALDRTQKILMGLPFSDPGRRALEQMLLYMNNNWQDLAADLAQLTAHRDLLMDMVKVVRDHRDPEHLDQVLRERLGYLIGVHLKTLKEQFEAMEVGRSWGLFYDLLLQKGAVVSPALPPRIPENTWDELPAWQAMAELCTTKSGGPRKQFGLKTGFYSGFKQTSWAEKLESLPLTLLDWFQKIKNYPAPNTSPVDVELLFDLILLISRVADQYRQISLKRGVIDFVELEQAALRVLSSGEGPTDLQLYLDQRINHILVDEFQDTSYNQWQLVQNLCAGWSPGDGRTLFIVGDPKQSIYGFRKAEVSLFLKARKGLPLPGQGTLPLKPIYISTNFRSRKRLVEFVNALFSETIMADPNLSSDEVFFRAARPAPDMETGDPGSIRLALFVKEEQTLLSRQKEAAWLAGEVKKAGLDTPGYSIGILLFARTHLPVYLKALYEQGLQVQVQEGLLLGHRPEVMDLLSLTRALVRPHDDLAWASLVRSPWCWVGQDELYRIARLPFPSFAEKIKNYSHFSEAPECLKRLGEVLLFHEGHIGRLPLSRVVQTVWETLSGPRNTAEHYGLIGVQNGRQFLQILSEVERGIPEETLSQLEIRLTTAYAPPDPSASRSAVSIMTVHHAKGLEFDTVFIPNLDRSPEEGGRGYAPPYMLEKLPGEREEHLVALRPDRRTKEDTGGYGLLRTLEKERRLGEAKRLSYVALTRAKKRLNLSGLVSVKEEEEKAPSHSLLWYILNHPGYENYLECLNDPSIPEFVRKPVQAIMEEAGDPLPFVSEPIPYRTISPSGLQGSGFSTDETEQLQEAQVEEQKDSMGLVRGTIIHRILEDLARGKDLPREKAVISALINQGVAMPTASNEGLRLLQEVEACRKESFCAFILRLDHPFSASEWALEDRANEQTIRSGIIDRVIFNGQKWFIVDYKTTPPPEDKSMETFLEEQAVLYRYQLLAYREMLARVRSIDPTDIHLFLYFTALQKEYEIKGEK